MEMFSMNEKSLHPTQSNYAERPLVDHPATQDHNDNKPPSFTPKRGAFGIIRKALVGIALVALLFGGYKFFGSTKDDIDPNTQKQWETAFIATQPLHVDIVKEEELPKAIATMNISRKDQKEIQTDIANGQTRLIWVTLWDTVAEDDDVVEIESGGFHLNILLKNAIQRIAVPEPPSGTLNLSGVRDGGGGITVGMLSGTSPVNLPLMEVGQALGVPVILPR